jgi:hypothetical protein
MLFLLQAINAMPPAAGRHLLFATTPGTTMPTPTPQEFLFDCSLVQRLPAQTSPTPAWDINLVVLEVRALGDGARRTPSSMGRAT